MRLPEFLFRDEEEDLHFRETVFPCQIPDLKIPAAGRHSLILSRDLTAVFLREYRLRRICVLKLFRSLKLSPCLAEPVSNTGVLPEVDDDPFQEFEFVRIPVLPVLGNKEKDYFAEHGRLIHFRSEVEDVSA